MALDKRKAVESALAYVQHGKLDRAIAEYQAILKVDPSDLTLLNTVGDLYARTGNKAEAIKHYMRLGEAYRSDGLSLKAIAVYKKILKLDPEYTDAYMACTDLYAEEGLVGEARMQLVGLADRYLKAENTARALEIYRKIVSMDPGNVTVATRFAELLARGGMRGDAEAQFLRIGQQCLPRQPTEATRFFKRALQLNPKSFTARLGLARAQALGGAVQEATEALERAKESAGTTTENWVGLGEALEEVGQSAQAEGCYQKAIELDPASPKAHLILAGYYFRQERPSQGARQLAAAVAQVSGEGLAEVHEVLEEHLRQTPDEIELHRVVVACLERQEAKEKMVDAIRTLVDRLEGLGRPADALSELHRLALACPEDTTIAERIGLLEERLAEGEAASRAASVASPPSVVEAEVVEADAASIETVPTVDEAVEEIGVAASPDETAEGVEEAMSVPPESWAVEEVAATLEEAPAVIEPELEGDAEVGSPERTAGFAATEEAPPEVWMAPDAPASVEGAQPEESVAFEVEGVDLDDLVESGLSVPQASAEEGMTTLSLEEPTPVQPDTGSPAAETAISERLPEPSVDFEDLADAEIPIVSVGEAPPAPRPERAGAEDREAEEQVAEAEVYWKYGLGDKAVERLQMVLQRFPDSIRGRRTLFRIQRDRGERSQAVANGIHLAERLFQQGAMGEAESVVDELERLMPGDLRVEELRGRLRRGAEVSQREVGIGAEGGEAPEALFSAVDLAEVDAHLTLGGRSATPGGSMVSRAGALQEGPEPEGFVDLSGELAREAGEFLSDLVEELHQGAATEVSPGDFETHYNLGIAYREMELYDEAIVAFRRAAGDPQLRVACSGLLGLCLLAKGQPEQAVEELKQGLALATGPGDARWGLLYDLATLYEAMEDWPSAIEALSQVQQEAPRFRDVRTRIRDLRRRIKG
ncbi:MAG: tetratricopeptide repeat protein [Candidatus Methylomirabilales bacterium]